MSEQHLAQAVIDTQATKIRRLEGEIASLGDSFYKVSGIEGTEFDVAGGRWSPQDLVDAVRRQDHKCWKEELAEADARAERAEETRQEQVAYSICIQRLVEHICHVGAIPEEVAKGCPHHAAMAKQHLDDRDRLEGELAAVQCKYVACGEALAETLQEHRELQEAHREFVKVCRCRTGCF